MANFGGTPHDYLLWYRNLSVPLANGLTFVVDVHEYRLSGATEKDHKVAEGMKAWRKLQPHLDEREFSAGTFQRKIRHTRPYPAQKSATPWIETVKDWRRVKACFQGRGSPPEIVQALRLANLFGLVEGTKDALQHYVDRNIGVDCSAFVGHYLAARGSAHGGAYLKSTQFAPVGTLLRDLAEVRGRDVISWVKLEHVAIIDKLSDEADGKVLDTTGNLAAVKAWVCESCGTNRVFGDVHSDGLNYTQYIITRAKPSLFVVRRCGGWEKAMKITWDEGKRELTVEPETAWIPFEAYISRLL
jgi:hypothetical protein